MTERIRQLCRIAPVFPVFICFAFGALCCGRAWGLVEIGLSLLCSALLCGWNWRLLLPALLCMGLGYLRFMLSEENGCGQLRGSGFAEFELESVPLTDLELQELDTGRGMIIASLRQASWLEERSGSGPGSGTLAVLLADNELRPQLRNLLPGELIKAGVSWERLPEAQDPVGGYYRDVLRSRDIGYLCFVNDFHTCGRSRSLRSRLRGMLYSLRARLAAILVKGVHNQECAGMLLALGLGMAEYMPADCVERMVASGTIHVFAISGMHVGMMAALFSRFLCWCRLPLCLRWLVTVPCIGGYVLLTGISVSALRALLMSIVIHYAYLRFRRPSWLNALGISGMVSLLLHPGRVLGMGFLYSYSIVAMLLLAAPMSEGITRMLRERLIWFPGKYRLRTSSFLCQNALLALQTSIVAWLTSNGVGMGRSAMVNFSAPLANLPLAMIAFFTLASCPLKIFLGWLCVGINVIAGTILDSMMRLMMALAEAGSNSSLLFCCGKVPFATNLLYNFFLVLWLLGYWRGSGGKHAET